MSIKVTPEFRSRALAFRAGIVVLVIVVAVLGLSFKAQTGMPFAPTTTVHALISDVHSLRVNDAVRENGKRIGRVSGISFRDGAADVTMALDGHVPVYNDAQASLRDLSALATKYVELAPGTPSAGDLGSATIPLAQTQPSADLYQVLNVLDPTTRDAATSALRQLGGGLAGHGQDLGDFVGASPDLVKNLGTVSATLADPSTNLVGLLHEADALTSHLSAQQGQLRQLMGQTSDTLAAIAVDSGQPLRSTIDRLPATLTSVDKAMSALKAPLGNAAQAMQALAPGADALGKATPDLRGFMREAVPVAAQVAPVATQAVPALDDLTKTMRASDVIASMVSQSLMSLDPFLRALAPYAPEMASLFERGRSFVSQGSNLGVRYARLAVTPGLNTVLGGVVPSGQNLPLDQYPVPGQAQNDRASGVTPVGLPKGLL